MFKSIYQIQLGSNQRPPDYECYYLVSTSLHRFVFVFSIREISSKDVYRLIQVFKISGSKPGPFFIWIFNV